MIGLNPSPSAESTHLGGAPSPRPRRTWLFMASLCCVTFAPGCIERTITIKTEPDQATVFLNDQEVGRSPVEVPFTWYGDYDIIIRKRGYESVRTHHKIRTPWYELPGIDIITECLVPFTVHDDHVLDTFVLEPQLPPGEEALLQAAAEMRAQALSDGK